MTEQFDIGQRLYWCDFDCPATPYGFGRYVVASGVVVTTGPAISTIWADEGSGRPNMITKANDKVEVDRNTVVAKIAAQNEEIAALRKSLLDDELEKFEQRASAATEVKTERSWRRRR